MVYISEENYNQRMQELAEPNWDKGTIGFFQGAQDIRIRYGFFPSEGGDKTAILLSGQSEFMERYKELIYDFNSRGYSVFTYDHRGQGGSGRISSTEKTTDVCNFWDYVADLELFIRDVVQKKPREKPFLFGHSMGGAIAAGYLTRRPESIQGAVLNAPMLGIISPLPLASDSVTSKIAKVLGSLPIIKKQRAPGRRKISQPNEYLKLGTTHSEARFNYLSQIAQDRSELVIDVASATFRMGGESYKFFDDLFRKGVIESIPTPILIMQASKDTLVCNEAMHRFHHRAPNSKLIKISPQTGESYHELHFEIDEIRIKTLDAVFAFFQESPQTLV